MSVQKGFGVLIIIFIITLFIGVGAGGYYLGTLKTSPQVNRNSLPGNINSKITNANHVGSKVASPTKVILPTPLPTPSIISVQWLDQPQLVAKTGFLALFDKYLPYEFGYCDNDQCDPARTLSINYEANTDYYLVGTSSFPEFVRGKVYLARVKNVPANYCDCKGLPTKADIKYDGILNFLYIQTEDNKYLVTQDYDNFTLFAFSNDNKNGLLSLQQANVNQLKNFFLDRSASTTYDPGYNVKLNLDRTNNFFDATSKYLVRDFGNGYKLFSNQDINNNPLSFKTLFNTVYTMRLPTNLAANVNYQNNDFAAVISQAQKSNPALTKINWTAGQPPNILPALPKAQNIGPGLDYESVDYTPNYDGCPSTLKLENITNNSEALDPTKELTAVANTNNGDTFYDLNNKNYKIFQAFYYSKVQIVAGLESITYDNYLKLYPVLIWRNPLGVYELLFRADLVNSSCWGEPLIYLYPTKPTQVQVNLSDKINLTASQPKYQNGWDLIAYPNSQIYDKNTQRVFPYLFWEGSAPNPNSRVDMDVVKKEDLHSYFESELARLGLFQKERTDFEKYWEKQLQTSPYYLLSFYDADSLNQIVPLDITPKPDSLIRILMTYQGLNQFENLNYHLPNYQTPKRVGFSAVEWGVVLHTGNIP
ncbi:hypothetical protein HY025_04580 [Candidatus Daviesbacteria bacterium]|nr:hypothetical protein [Candidatus Daviesbacteria bacterium]